MLVDSCFIKLTILAKLQVTYFLIKLKKNLLQFLKCKVFCSSEISKQL